MKRNFALLLLASLFSISAHAYYVAWARLKVSGIVYEYLDAITDIAHDDQYVYVSSLHGFVVIDKATGEQTVYSITNGNIDYTTTALTVHDGKLWIGTKANDKYTKLLSFDGQAMTAYDFDFYNSYISNIVFDADGCMYVSCGSGYTFRIEEGQTPEVFSVYRLKDGWTAHLAVAHDGTLWVANYGWNMSPKSMAKYTVEEGVTYPMETITGLPNYRVTAIAIDDEDGVWYSSTHNMFEPGGERLLIRLKDDQVSAYYDCVYRYYDMEFDAEQRLWLAGDYGPLTMMKDGEFTSYPCQIENERWMCMDIDGDDIYIGTENSLLLYRDGEYLNIDQGPLMQQAVTSVTGIIRDAFSPLFDLYGRRLSEKPEHGVYIQNGKKHVVR